MRGVVTPVEGLPRFPRWGRGDGKRWTGRELALSRPSLQRHDEGAGGRMQPDKGSFSGGVTLPEL